MSKSAKEPVFFSDPACSFLVLSTDAAARSPAPPSLTPVAASDSVVSPAAVAAASQALLVVAAASTVAVPLPPLPMMADSLPIPAAASASAA